MKTLLTKYYWTSMRDADVMSLGFLKTAWIIAIGREIKSHNPSTMVIYGVLEREIIIWEATSKNSCPSPILQRDYRWWAEELRGGWWNLKWVCNVPLIMT